jgi:hypothetical protein
MQADPMLRGMDEGHRSDLSLAREYVRAVTGVGHAGFLARATGEELSRLRMALARIGAIHEAMILDEAMTIDRASRDIGGHALRDYLELEERALARLDRELFGQLPSLEARLAARDAAAVSARSA